MDARADRVRRRFDSMLSDARAAIRNAAADPLRPGGGDNSLLASAKALNRAGGFLEAIAITFPDLGRELIGKFEEVAREVEQIPYEPAGYWVTRSATERRTGIERRQPGRQRADDGEAWEQAAEPRISERRVLADRRYGAKADI